MNERPADTELLELQAIEIRRQAERTRELIRERDAALSREEAALDLAEQYARESGVDIERDGILKYVEQYWNMRGQWEKRMTTLETFHWDILGLERELSEGVTSGAAAATGGDTLAARVVARIHGVHQGVSPGKGGQLFPRPALPDADELPARAAASKPGNLPDRLPAKAARARKHPVTVYLPGDQPTLMEVKTA